MGQHTIPLSSCGLGRVISFKFVVDVVGFLCWGRGQLSVMRSVGSMEADDNDDSDDPDKEEVSIV